MDKVRNKTGMTFYVGDTVRLVGRPDFEVKIEELVHIAGNTVMARTGRYGDFDVDLLEHSVEAIEVWREASDKYFKMKKELSDIFFQEEDAPTDLVQLGEKACSILGFYG